MYTYRYLIIEDPKHLSKYAILDVEKSTMGFKLTTNTFRLFQPIKINVYLIYNVKERIIIYKNSLRMRNNKSA